mmetsp:Transcript_15593/g.23233  ORF Transcript_15593/g.23233 Transcript_15593/m.23233 type:complete len:220 (-) Transcript_15593:263-922(-)
MLQLFGDSAHQTFIHHIVHSSVAFVIIRVHHIICNASRKQRRHISLSLIGQVKLVGYFLEVFRSWIGHGLQGSVQNLSAVSLDGGRLACVLSLEDSLRHHRHILLHGICIFGDFFMLLLLFLAPRFLLHFHQQSVIQTFHQMSVLQIASQVFAFLGVDIDHPFDFPVVVGIGPRPALFGPVSVLSLFGAFLGNEHAFSPNTFRFRLLRISIVVDSFPFL